MSDKKLTFLGILALVLLILAIVIAKVTKVKPQPSLVGTTLLQGMDPSSIDKITLGPTDKLATLKHSGDHFVAVDKMNYPVSNQQVNDLLTKCLDIKINQLMTDNSSNHADLGVTEDTARYVVRFYNAQDELITGLIVGNAAEGIRGTYVRAISDDLVYLSAETPFFRMTSLDYLDKSLCRVDDNKIEEVEVTTPSDSYTIIKKDGKPVLKILAPDATPKDYEIRSVFHSLGSLDFSDVTTADQVADLKFDSSYVCKLSDSTIYTLELAKKGEDYYLKIRSEFTDTTPVSIDRTKKDSDEELKVKEAKLVARDDSKAFNERHSSWVYKLAGWQANKLDKPYSALVEVAEPKPAEPAQTPQTDSVPAPAVPQAAPVPAAAPSPEAVPAVPAAK